MNPSALEFGYRHAVNSLQLAVKRFKDTKINKKMWTKECGMTKLPTCKNTIVICSKCDSDCFVKTT